MFSEKDIRRITREIEQILSEVIRVRVVRELHHLATHFGEDPNKFVVRYYPGQRKAKA